MKFRKNLFDTQPIRTSFYFSVCNVCVYLFIYLFVCAADHVDVVCMHARTFMLIRIRSYESCMWHRSTAKHIQSIGDIPYDFAVFFCSSVYSYPVHPLYHHSIHIEHFWKLSPCRATNCCVHAEPFVSSFSTLFWLDVTKQGKISFDLIF